MSSITYLNTIDKCYYSTCCNIAINFGYSEITNRPLLICSECNTVYELLDLLKEIGYKIENINFRC